jgi:nodulation protein F
VSSSPGRPPTTPFVFGHLPEISCRMQRQARQSQEVAMADQLATEIIEKIRTVAGAGGGEITLETDLQDIGIHSLELTEIVFDLEEAYGIDIDMNTAEAWNQLRNVADIVEATRALIAAKAA